MRTLSVFAVASCLLALPAFGAEMKMSPEMMKAMTPGEAHKGLSEMAGNWKYTMKMWMDAASAPQESKGTSKARIILGGRFLQEDVKAKMNGMPFEGISLVGFDNMRQAYQSVWLDNMTTGMMIGQGKESDGVVKEEGTFSCPMTMDPNRKYRTEMKVVDKDHHLFSMFSNDKDGKEFKMMEISYARAK
jgi:hypothetical protein